MPCKDFLSSQITNSLSLDVFSPTIAAIGSANASIAKLIMTNSEYCQKPITRIKYPSGKYIVPYEILFVKLISKKILFLKLAYILAAKNNIAKNKGK